VAREATVAMLDFKGFHVIRVLALAGCLCCLGVHIHAGETSLDTEFQQVADSRTVGEQYVSLRDKLMKNDNARLAEFLEGMSRNGKTETDRVLARILLLRARHASTFARAHARLAQSVSTILELGKKLAQRGMAHSSSGITSDPMEKLIKCMRREEAAELRNLLLERAELAIKAGHHPSGAGRPGFLPPEETPDSFRRWTVAFCDARWWDNSMPNLGPAMLEIALKGWPDEEAAAALSQAGWGRDFYRYMAVHVLGELRHKPAVGVLLDLVKNRREDKYLRAHAVRALCKIADPATLQLLIEMRFDEKLAIPREALRECDLRRFPPRAIVKTYLGILADSKDVATRKAAAQALSGWAPKDRASVPSVTKALKQIISGKEDASLRHVARRALEHMQVTGKDYEVWLDKYVLHCELEFDDVLDIDDEEVVYAAAEGKAKAADLARVQEKYIKIVGQVAAQYTGGNAFATKKLHNDGWPGTVKNGEARAFCMALAALKTGTPEEKTIKVLGLTKEEQDWPLEETRLGKKVRRLPVSRVYDNEVEGPFGTRTKMLQAVLVFVDGKLKLVQAPSP